MSENGKSIDIRFESAKLKHKNIIFSWLNEPHTDTFFIDPDVKNPRAKHVYEKAGFEFIADFLLEGNGCFSGRQTHFLVKRLSS
jgi:hypothetical protein